MTTIIKVLQANLTYLMVKFILGLKNIVLRVKKVYKTNVDIISKMKNLAN